MNRIQHCRSCNAEIIFLPTRAGKAMPCDAPSVEPLDVEFDYKRHRSHFSTCPKADQHRKSK